MAEIDETLEQTADSKEALVEEAEKLAASEDLAGSIDAAKKLTQRWKRLSRDDWGSVADEQLQEQFDGYLDKIYAKKNEISKAAADAKKEIIAKAKEAAAADNFKEAAKVMDSLMEEWKATGRTDKKTDDELWAEFRAARDTFYTRRKEYFDGLSEKFEAAKTTKEALIEKAKELSESKEWKKTTEAMNGLMEQWKAAGSAGKKFENDLWDQFSAAKKVFFDAKSAYYDELRATYDERAKAKEALVDTAKEIVDKGEFTKEITERVKGLREEWKKIGSCGKEKEDAIWNEFNGTIKTYFDGLKEFNDGKHAEWLARMQDSIEYKKNQIGRIQREIGWIKRDAENSFLETALVEAEEEIARKNEYIAKLENDIKEMEAKISK